MSELPQTVDIVMICLEIVIIILLIFFHILTQFFFHFHLEIEINIKIEIKILLFFDLFVYDQGGGTPLVSDQDEGAGEEAESPAGGARGLEELWGEGSIFAARSISAATPTSICLEEVEGSGGAPADYCCTPV